MGRMKFGSSLQRSTPEKLPDQVLVDMGQNVVDTVIRVDQPVYITVPPAPEIIEIEKIVYVDKPVEVIKYVDREVIKEVPVIVEKVVVIEKESTPQIKEVIVEKVIEKEVEVKNQINTILIYIIALSLLANVIQGLF